MPNGEVDPSSAVIRKKRIPKTALSVSKEGYGIYQRQPEDEDTEADIPFTMTRWVK